MMLLYSWMYSFTALRSFNFFSNFHNVSFRYCNKSRTITLWSFMSLRNWSNFTFWNFNYMSFRNCNNFRTISTLGPMLTFIRVVQGGKRFEPNFCWVVMVLMSFKISLNSLWPQLMYFIPFLKIIDIKISYWVILSVFVYSIYK